MNFDDLVGFEEEDVGELACYVCGDQQTVIRQDVITSVDPFEAETLPVCSGCRNAVGLVLQLESDFEKVAEANGTLSMRAIALAALLDEGRQIVLQLQSENLAQAQRITELELDITNLNAEAENLYVDNASLAKQVDDLENRIENGAGLNDVEFVVIASANYEE